MKASNATKVNILELCSEGPYGSWEFWLKIPKTESQAIHIVNALIDLVKEEKIIPMEYASVLDWSHKATPLDIEGLEKEIKGSIDQYKNVIPENFYWFIATQLGTKEDKKNAGTVRPLRK